jgi:hypothetical protein
VVTVAVTVAEVVTGALVGFLEGTDTVVLIVLSVVVTISAVVIPSVVVIASVVMMSVVTVSVVIIPAVVVIVLSLAFRTITGVLFPLAGLLMALTWTYG